MFNYFLKNVDNIYDTEIAYFNDWSIQVGRIKIILLTVVCMTAFSFGLDLDEAHYNLAQKFYAEKKYPEALQEFNLFMDKYPDSRFFNKAVFYSAKIYYQLKNYDKSLTLYTMLDKNAENDNDRKTALFGIGESYFKLKDWSDAALSFKKFVFLYKTSPVYPASLYYGGKAYEELKCIPEAKVFFECLVRNYPRSPYYPEALNLLQKFGKYETIENKIKNSEFTNRNTGNLKITNRVELTNIVLHTNMGTGRVTNIITNYLTNTYAGNQSVITQVISGLDTNELEMQKLSEENRKKQEEIQRYRELIELKDNLLNLKEKAINDKKDILYDTNSSSESNTTVQ